ncbi:DUF3379 family protein [Hydrogenovibrio sp. 3SP14C1]|uniref:DUF3379 family protein n=1 Tax=Hydrogenovibrio sp. 3SP14C1 TaxID=3038774 RepID=UPI0024173E27|nr:DUF3379 family protein [Hydrogenovibrio sp. 3SP14C1]MDG4812338.1 DUF3379 family protein [Hydrogenovibrio sp. 3SP14C1]
MNEFEFQQKVQQNPKQLDADMLAFLKEHPEKMEWVKAARVFDDQLSRALSVEVPEGLHDRILLKNSFELSAANDRHWLKNLSLFAASFVGVVFIFNLWVAPLDNDKAATSVQLSGQAQQMEAAIIEHIFEHAKDAPEIMQKHAQNLQETELEDIFSKVGVILNKPVEFMSYAGECEVDGQKGLHLVLQEIEGPVTIIVLPGKRIQSMQAFRKSGLEGQMIPVNGGVVAVVGQSFKQLASAQKHFFQSVTFG